MHPAPLELLKAGVNLLQLRVGPNSQKCKSHTEEVYFSAPAVFINLFLWYMACHRFHITVVGQYFLLLRHNHEWSDGPAYIWGDGYSLCPSTLWTKPNNNVHLHVPHHVWVVRSPVVSCNRNDCYTWRACLATPQFVRSPCAQVLLLISWKLRNLNSLIATLDAWKSVKICIPSYGELLGEATL